MLKVGLNKFAKLTQIELQNSREGGGIEIMRYEEDMCQLFSEGGVIICTKGAHDSQLSIQGVVGGRYYKPASNIFCYCTFHNSCFVLLIHICSIPFIYCVLVLLFSEYQITYKEEFNCIIDFSVVEKINEKLHRSTM